MDVFQARADQARLGMWQPIDLGYEELPGLSRALLSAHYDLYLGYISRLNKIWSERMNRSFEDPFEYGRLASEEGFLRNAVRLHELYFENLTPGGAGDPFDVIGDDETVDRWESNVRLLALSSSGWVIHADDLPSGHRFLFTMKEHGQGFIAQAWPLVVIDCYEHAYAIDYGTSKEDYIEAVLENIDWNVAAERGALAAEFASDGLR